MTIRLNAIANDKPEYEKRLKEMQTSKVDQSELIASLKAEIAEMSKLHKDEINLEKYKYAQEIEKLRINFKTLIQGTTSQSELLNDQTESINDIH